VHPEGLAMKNSINIFGNRTRDLRLVVQCLNELCHRETKYPLRIHTYSTGQGIPISKKVSVYYMVKKNPQSV
jgi:hypothetical protein